MSADSVLAGEAAPRGPWYLRYEPRRRWIRGAAYRQLKRALDVAICLVVIPLVLPLLAAIAVGVYLDSPGRVVFCQQRTGMGGRRFRMYKFRTMVPNAEELKAAYAHLNELS